MKIDKPDWHQLIWLDNKLWTNSNAQTKLELNQWFDKHVAPINKMLSEGVRDWRSDERFTGCDNITNGFFIYTGPWLVCSRIDELYDR